MQGNTCAYCERAIYKPGESGEIEHFVQKGKKPSVTFEWTNLFWSCKEKTSCGKHKDNGVRRNSYQPEDLIKPDEESPAHFFTYDTAGTIAPKEGLDLVASHRARVTIRVFNLNSKPARLPRLRASAWAAIQEQVIDLQLFADDGTYPAEDLRAEAQRILDDRYGDEFSACLVDLIEQFLPLGR